MRSPSHPPTADSRRHRSRCVACIAAAIAAGALAACAGPYSRALREMAQPHDNLLTMRIGEFVRAANHAVVSLDRVRQWYLAHTDAPTAEGADAALRIARGQAEAYAFDAARRAISVDDVIAQHGLDPAPHTDTIRQTIAHSVDAIRDAVGIMLRNTPDDPAWITELASATEAARRSLDTVPRAHASHTHP